MSTAAQLRAARAYLHWTMEQAAAAAGLHRRTAYRLEKGGSNLEAGPPSLDKLVAVYQAEGIILTSIAWP